MQKMMENRLQIDWTYHEADMARMERITKRLWIALIIVILLFTVSNAAWIYYESQFEDVVTETVTQESDAKDGGTAIVNYGGDLNYGESTANGDTD